MGFDITNYEFQTDPPQHFPFRSSSTSEEEPAQFSLHSPGERSHRPSHSSLGRLTTPNLRGCELDGCEKMRAFMGSRW